MVVDYSENSFTLQGIKPNTTATANTIVQRNSAGEIYTTHLNMTADYGKPTPHQIVGMCDNDNWLRYFLPVTLSCNQIFSSSSTPTFAAAFRISF